MKERAQQVVSEIETSFKHCGTALTEDLAAKIITQKLEETFQDLSTEDRTAFYKALSLEFHPDKLNNKTMPFVQYLKSLDQIDLPQKLLGNYKDAPSAQALFEDPTAAASDWATYILRNKLKYLDDNYERYFQPFPFLISTIKGLLIIANIIVVGAVLGLAGIIALPQFLIKSTMDFILDGKIDKFIDQEALKVLKRTVKNLHPNSPDEDIDDGVNYYAATEDGKEAISKISVRHIHRLKAVAKALWETISEDLPESKIMAFFSVALIRPLAIVFTPVFLTIEATFELIRLIHATVVVTLLVSFIAQISAYLALVNLPLFLVDGIGLAFHNLSNAFSHSEENYVPADKPTAGAAIGRISYRLNSDSDHDSGSAFDGGYGFDLRAKNKVPPASIYPLDTDYTPTPGY